MTQLRNKILTSINTIIIPAQTINLNIHLIKFFIHKFEQIEHDYFNES